MTFASHEVSRPESEGRPIEVALRFSSIPAIVPDQQPFRAARRRSRADRGRGWASRVCSWAALLAIVAALFAPSQSALAAITFVKDIGTNSSAVTGTTIAVTVPAAGVAAGNTVILTLAMGDAAGTVTATDTSSNTYTVAADVTNAAHVRTVILAASNVTALASGHTITVTHPSVASRALEASEFSGVSKTARGRSCCSHGKQGQARRADHPPAAYHAKL